eukprot:TRINITY_DN496_c0_g1_i2.p1 TRINITY_DN496_c0_g1~~TRINITY_DN496_c0_g1_i2.p1  ORF type:complete len:185 (+),score=66.72 TRINITY_DN496_c0_g1_i2:49-555(+)
MSGVPGSALGVAILIGFAYEALNYDVFDDDSRRVEVVTGFYYGKAIQQAIFYKLLLLLFLIGGLINYGSALLSLFSKNTNNLALKSIRKYNLIGVLLFAANLTTNLVFVVPNEKKLGNLHNTNASIEIVSNLQSTLFYQHLLIIFISIGLIWQQIKCFGEKNKSSKIE